MFPFQEDLSLNQQVSPKFPLHQLNSLNRNQSPHSPLRDRSGFNASFAFWRTLFNIRRAAQAGAHRSHYDSARQDACGVPMVQMFMDTYPQTFRVATEEVLYPAHNVASSSLEPPPF